MDAEDEKLVTLARAALARALVRTMPPTGAAVRDDMGRTYAAATVEVDGASVTGLQLAVASAISSGARAFEAAAIVGAQHDPADEGLTALEAFGPVATVIRARPDGSVVG
ncbi:MAG TPA: cytidine deaminase [Mycobacteriales bacterium]|jgi:cytidine deaminase